MEGLFSLGLALCAVAPLGSQAACSEWNVGGKWTLVQGNGYYVFADLTQRNGVLTGKAAYNRNKNAFNHDGAATGRVDGTISGDRVQMRIYWITGNATDRNIGVYEGRISGTGQIEGSTYSQQQKSDRTTWFSDVSVPCAAASTSGAGFAGAAGAASNLVGTSEPKAIRRLGKRSPSNTQPQTGAEQAIVAANDVETTKCKTGYVWREASEGDFVCVTTEERERIAAENRLAASRRDPNGVYGPNTCKTGYVWREALAGDSVCVLPARRDQARSDNAQGAARRVNY